MFNLLAKIIGTKNERELRRIRPVVDKINEKYEYYRKTLRDEELPKITEEFKERLRAGETMDDILVDAYALVKDACRRLLGKSWPVTGIEKEWDMVPYDVQLIGAVVLHEGKIAEMATGEGKTLVATMPLYLNALTGRGVHLVTVNDYLARRDREWMGPVYESLGLTVGVIQAGMSPDERRPQYECDITYGTNNEFGFDYLRDNMAIRPEHRVQRGHYYAIIDEVDSVLIDEARTPLIISGPVPVEESRVRIYKELKPRVERVVYEQTRLVNKLVSEAERLLRNGNRKEAGIKLLQAKRGAPKNKRLMKLMHEPGVQQLIEETEAKYMKEKKLHELDEVLYFSIDEKSNIVDITEKGRKAIAPDNPDFFTLPDLPIELKKIDEQSGLSPRERAVLRDKVQREYAEKSEKIHAVTQLLKAYSLFERDVEYIVQDGRVIIVDEFTGRLMPGRRYSDGLHEALEAKEGVRVERETQTLATITLQNYFRMYEKLAGMTGTAATEAQEFWEIYKLDVVVIPTHKPVRRVDYDDLIFRTKREKYKAIIEEVERLHKKGIPVLVGTVSVEVSETLSRMLQRRGIKHEVLNAKHHQREAEIVAHAGERGRVTIATNMAGRGTDIKLGPGVVKCDFCILKLDEELARARTEEERKKILEMAEKTRKKLKEAGLDPDGKDCLEDMPCGLHIIGSERHDARRIDLQLRGRSGRQGDPGSSRFYISLEDDLMRLFARERIARVMDRMGIKEGEPIKHPLITRAIENAQRRVERYHFDIRKRLLEFDDVMNKQREVIYGWRNEILDGKNMKDRVLELIDYAVEEIVDSYTQA
ncbi:preprotein translocase subunit SecA, partial [bacterium]